MARIYLGGGRGEGFAIVARRMLDFSLRGHFSNFGREPSCDISFEMFVTTYSFYILPVSLPRLWHFSKFCRHLSCDISSLRPFQLCLLHKKNILKYCRHYQRSSTHHGDISLESLGSACTPCLLYDALGYGDFLGSGDARFVQFET